MAQGLGRWKPRLLGPSSSTPSRCAILRSSAARSPLTPLETINAARQPDLVVLYNSGPNVTAARQLERIGIRTVLLDLNRLEDLGPATRTLGRLTGLEQRADSLARVMDGFTATPLHSRPPSSTVAFVVWDNPPIIIGRGSYLDELATLAGARNVFHDVAAPSSQSGW